MIEINTVVSVGDTYGRGIPNITLEDAKFYGRPNFAGEEDRFKDSRRKFTVLIPNDVADQLRAIGYNVKTPILSPEDIAEGREQISHLKVMVDNGSDVWVKMGDDLEKLVVGGPQATVGIMDRSRIEMLDMEIRGWEYKPEEEPGKHSARLVSLVANLRPNRLAEKYGNLTG